MTLPDQINVVILIFDGVNTLDVNGPLEVLCNYALRRNFPEDPNWCPFKVHIASKTLEPIRAYEFIHMVASIDYKQALAMIDKKEVQILITPGYAGNPDVLEKLIHDNDPIFDVIKAFYKQDSTDEDRWIISICVGALLYAHAGVFDGTTATTHWGAVQGKKIEHYSHGKAKSVRKRWVESAPVRGIRRLSSGGISCGLDAMLYFISQLETLGLSDAQDVAHMMDYAWNGGPPQPAGKEITQQ